MNKRILTFGVEIGLVGGILMAAFAMTTMWLLGNGFFTVVNLIAATFYADAPLDGTLTLAALELGLVIHLLVSIIVGTTIAYLVERENLDGGILFLLALGIGACAWVIQSFAWPAIASDAHAAFTPWVLAVAHVTFALGAAFFLTWLEKHDGRPDGQPDLQPVFEDSGVGASKDLWYM